MNMTHGPLAIAAVSCYTRRVFCQVTDLLCRFTPRSSWPWGAWRANGYTLFVDPFSTSLTGAA